MSDRDPDERRTISDADVKAVVKELKKELLADLYTNAGKGVLAWVWRGFMTLLILLALYGVAFESGVQVAAPHVGVRR